MLLRSTLVFLNGAQTSRGSSLCHLSRKSLLAPKLPHVRFNNAPRPGFRTAPVVRRSLVSELKIPFLFTATTGSLCLYGHEYFGKLVSQSSKLFPSSWYKSEPDWSKAFYLIFGTCAVIFCGFRLAMIMETSPAFYQFMNRYFVLKPTPDSPLTSCAQIILSAFSHDSPLHIAANMFVLYNVTNTVAQELGPSKFLGCYFFSAIVSGFLSLTYSHVRRRMMGSIGASGAILGLIAMTVYRHPEFTIHIIFLPMFPVPAPTAIVALASIDLLGVIRAWNFFDHAGHLGGLFSGIIWELCQVFVKKTPVDTFKSKISKEEWW